MLLGELAADVPHPTLKEMLLFKEAARLLAQTFTSCRTAGKFLNLSVPQLPDL